MWYLHVKLKKNVKNLLKLTVFLFKLEDIVVLKKRKLRKSQ